MRIKCADALSSKGGSIIGDVITCAGDMLNLFVQLNWTGPPPAAAPAGGGDGDGSGLEEWLAPLVGGSTILSQINKESLDHLSWDGEVLYV